MNNHCRNIKVVKGEKQQLRSRTKSNCCFSYLIIIIARRFHKSLLTHSPALCIPVTLRQTPLRNANIVIISISYRLKFIVVHIDYEQLNSSSAEATASCQFATQLNYFVRRSINNYCRDTILLNCAEYMKQKFPMVLQSASQPFETALRNAFTILRWWWWWCCSKTCSNSFFLQSTYLLSIPNVALSFVS